MRIYAWVMLSMASLLGACHTPTMQAQPAESNNRYNVLFIAVDDLRPELGCYGVDYVRTPNIDKLAGTGVLFKQHFVMMPTCGASRYALLTGRDSMKSKGTHNGAFYTGGAALKQETLPGAQSLPELFRRSGYRTVLIGKVSHTADGKVTAYNGSGDKRPELPNAWDDFATPYGPWQRGWGVFFAYADGKHREDGGGHRDLMQFTVEQDTDLPDGLMAEAAIDKLKALKERDEPFFLGLGFFKPHLPFVAPKRDWDAVDKWDVPTPAFREGIETAYYNGGNGEFYGYKMGWEKTKPLALEDAMQAKRGYLACVRYVDRQIGKVLDALEEEGLADNTVVVLWGDHGWFLGEAAMWAKHTTLETAVHAPLIIRAPGVGKAGVKTDALASTIDLYPTLLDLCKPSFTRTEHELDGVSLVPVLTGEKNGVREIVPSYWRGATSLRSSTHRVVYKSQRGAPTHVELYDLTKPNGAWIDVIKQQPNAAVLEHLPDR
ncbi:MAG: sulfatase [Phycisphaeraceae bacterium]